jgi:segregation and condensation protein B
MKEQKKMIEAALFISDRPLSLDYLGRVSGVNSLGYVREIIENLQKDYEKRGLEIVKTPHGWVMQVKQDLLEKVAHLTPYYDLSEGCKRTLALVAYKEPVKQSEIIKMQGNKAYSYIKSLVRRDLIRAEKSGHTKTLKLTQEFERYFGEEKERIKEQLKGMIKEPKRTEKPVEENVEEEAKDIEERMDKIEEMFEVPEDLKTKIKDEKPGVKRRKPKRGKGKKAEPKMPKRDIRASHTHAFEEIG